MVTNETLGELLKRTALLPPGQLEFAMHEQARTGIRLGQVLVDLGLVDEGPLYDAIAHVAEIPRLDLRSVPVDLVAAGYVDPSWSLDHGMVPLSLDDRTGLLRVALVDPTDSEPIRELSRRTGLRVTVVLGSESEIGRLIRAQFFHEPLDRDPVTANRRRGGVDARFALNQLGATADVAASASLRPAPPPVPPPSDDLPEPHLAAIPVDASERAALAQLKPIFERQQEGARWLQAIFALCISRGIITREEYLERLARLSD